MGEKWWKSGGKSGGKVGVKQGTRKLTSVVPTVEIFQEGWEAEIWYFPGRSTKGSTD